LDTLSDFKPGTKVRLVSTGEVGVVIWAWEDDVVGRDLYVAFFGRRFPNGVPEAPPYVLRYLPSSLELFDQAG